MPFGKSSVIVEAESKQAAIEKVKAENAVSSRYRVTASPARKPKCRHCKSTDLRQVGNEYQCQNCLWYQK